MSAPAVFQTLEQAWNVLEPLSLPMAVAGGLALSAWRHPRATRDVDLVIAISVDAGDDLLRRLTEAGFRARHRPAIRPLGMMHLMQLEYEPKDAFMSVAVDLLLVHTDYHREALMRRLKVQLPELSRPVYVLACEDLILHKLSAGRIIDLADVAVLLRANRDTLDLPYLTRWAMELEVTADLVRVWKEAFGNDSELPY